MKRFLWPGIVLVIVLSFGLIWRLQHPPLSPQQQVELQLEGLREAVESRSVRAASGFLARDFVWEGAGGATRKEILDGARGAFFSWRDVHAETSGVQTTVTGDRASTHGNLRLTLRPSPDAEVETRTGTFDFEWQQRDGVWKIVKARGGQDLAR